MPSFSTSGPVIGGGVVARSVTVCPVVTSVTMDGAPDAVVLWPKIETRLGCAASSATTSCSRKKRSITDGGRSAALTMLMSTVCPLLASRAWYVVKAALRPTSVTVSTPVIPMSVIHALLRLRELHDVERIEGSAGSSLVGRVPDVDLGQQRERLVGVGGGEDDDVASAVAPRQPLGAAGRQARA